jgi:hypothetical protein
MGNAEGEEYLWQETLVKYFKALAGGNQHLHRNVL